MLIEKGVIALSILGGSMALAQNIVHQPVNPNGVTQVHTALDHISILALPEKITRVAAGSDAIQIEWHDNSVFIKPLKAGQSTNLMVWTEHQMSTYELEAPGDVHSMSFVIDETASPIPQAHAQAATSSTPEEMQRRYRFGDRIHLASGDASCAFPGTSSGQRLRERGHQGSRARQ